VLLKNPENLTEKQRATLAGLQRTGGLLWKAYQLKESLRKSSQETWNRPKSWK